MYNVKYGIKVPEVMLPDKKVNYDKWAVIACDQYTSQPEYWNEVEKIVGDEPSTLKIIFPEIYLETGDSKKRIEEINETMESYIKDKVLIEQGPGFIIVDRKTLKVPSRKGLILEVDLDEYDYGKESKSLIRATEGTVLDRLPPRMKIREHAAVELPHIMLLIDDPEKTVIEPLFEKACQLEKVYDFELMLNGGHIKGYRVQDEETIEKVTAALGKLADKEAFCQKYGVKEDTGLMLFAAGDGNHSLATAKAHWEHIKTCLNEDEAKNHPARFALVELVNVHDEGLEFHPIHRVIFNVEPLNFLEEMKVYMNQKGQNSYYKLFATEEEMKVELSNNCGKDIHCLPFVIKGNFGVFFVENPIFNLEVGTLQDYLSAAEVGRIKVDYIHGDDVVTSLGSKDGNMGFYLPALNKNELFRTVILEGALPRKTFSMGEAEEKRYYLECRRIR